MLFFIKDFQNELDSRYDKHERIVKSSRDITIQSKRTIFYLHRYITSEHTTTKEKHSKDSKNGFFVKAMHKLVSIKDILKTIACELQEEDPARYHRAYTNGVQELVEALSFYYYLKDGKLISFEEAKQWMTFSLPINDAEQKNESQDDNDVQFPLTVVDYVLGIGDLTGEIMRLSISAMGTGDWSLPFRTRDFMRSIRAGFQSLLPIYSDVNHKLHTLNQSLFKIERLCYDIKLKGSENISRHLLELQANNNNTANDTERSIN